MFKRTLIKGTLIQSTKINMHRMNRVGLAGSTYLFLIICSLRHEGETSLLNNDATTSTLNTTTRPLFTIFTSSGEMIPGKSIDVMENQMLGKVVALLEVSESINDTSRSAVCSTDSDMVTLRQIELGTYTIITMVNIDREKMDTFDFKVICTNSDNQMKQTALINVTVSDMNDNAPVFQNGNYEFDIFENIEPRSIISTVKAVDRDNGQNGLVAYYLEKDAEQMFEINSSSGEIRTKVSFDKEMRDSYQFIVMAKDHGDYQYTGTTKVHINIKDVNDNAPFFVNEEFKFVIKDRIENGTAVAQLLAYDIDESTQSLVYSVRRYYTDLFYIPFDVLTNGTIVTTADIALDKKVIFMFGVIVKDSGASFSLSSSAMVYITYEGRNAC